MMIQDRLEMRISQMFTVLMRRYSTLKGTSSKSHVISCIRSKKHIHTSKTVNAETLLQTAYCSPTYLVTHYQDLVEKGIVQSDRLQLIVLKELDRLRAQLLSYSDSYNKFQKDDDEDFNSLVLFGENSRNKGNRFVQNASIGDDEGQESSISSFFGKLFTLSDESKRRKFPSLIPKGVYIHGGVGCGKTFCMNLFYDSLPTTSCSEMDGSNFYWGKQKVHFHKFMLGIHKQMHEAKHIEGIKGDVLPRVIEKTIQKGRILCFDEFQVTDVADALILRRLFTGLLERDAVIVATSNRPPRDLYLNGLQRDLFLPFIDLLEERTTVTSMWQSETDYRLIQGENKARGVYFIGPESKIEFEQVFSALTKHSPTESASLSIQGRIVHVPRASMMYGVARFTFDDLCCQAKGAADYLLIGETFHTVFIEEVPILNENAINLVRRFIIFIDAMYESHVKLIIHAMTPPQGIFKVDLANKFIDEVFAFDRTRSRLEEMSSDSYLQKKWQGKSSNSYTSHVNTMVDSDFRQ